jgi:hypothetical protein
MEQQLEDEQNEKQTLQRQKRECEVRLQEVIRHFSKTFKFN